MLCVGNFSLLISNYRLFKKKLYLYIRNLKNAYLNPENPASFTSANKLCRAIKTVEKNGGIDNYIINTKNSDLTEETRKLKKFSSSKI